jgi:transcriptional regulator with XRE-family HTH domain
MSSPRGGENTQEEVAAAMGISRQRVAQIEAQALVKLRRELGPWWDIWLDVRAAKPAAEREDAAGPPELVGDPCDEFDDQIELAWRAVE